MTVENLAMHRDFKATKEEIKKMVDEGLVEYTGGHENGSPKIRITEKGIKAFKNEKDKRKNK